MNKELVNKCIKALADAIFWDIWPCPFCGIGPRHADDCPVIIADKIVEENCEVFYPGEIRKDFK